MGNATQEERRITANSPQYKTKQKALKTQIINSVFHKVIIKIIGVGKMGKRNLSHGNIYRDCIPEIDNGNEK